MVCAENSAADPAAQAALTWVELSGKGCQFSGCARTCGHAEPSKNTSSFMPLALVLIDLLATTKEAISAMACQRYQSVKRAHWSCPMSRCHWAPGCSAAKDIRVSMVKLAPGRRSSRSSTTTSGTPAKANWAMAKRWWVGLSRVGLCHASPVGITNKRCKPHWATKARAMATWARWGGSNAPPYRPRQGPAPTPIRGEPKSRWSGGARACRVRAFWRRPS